VPDREVAARLAALRRDGVDLERRMRADIANHHDSEDYWRVQVDAWRSRIVGALERFPFHQRAIQQLPLGASSEAEPDWRSAMLDELSEIRSRLDLTMNRLV
jgi:hypothetical protein